MRPIDSDTTWSQAIRGMIQAQACRRAPKEGDNYPIVVVSRHSKAGDRKCARWAGLGHPPGIMIEECEDCGGSGEWSTWEGRNSLMSHQEAAVALRQRQPLVVIGTRIAKAEPEDDLAGNPNRPGIAAAVLSCGPLSSSPRLRMIVPVGISAWAGPQPAPRDGASRSRWRRE
jgi:hypothetical protein